VIFETERLRARDWSPDDAAAVFEIYRDPDVVRFLGSVPQPVLDENEAAQRIERWTAYNANAGTGYGFWALETRDGTLVGATLLKPLPEAEEVEVGWHLGRAYWGSGYATEGARGAVTHGFAAVPSLDTVHAVIYRDNAASLAVARRLGMTPHGPTDRYYGVTLELFSLRRP
jgi:RimJ/RimL family protein N-acetyltransferase